MALTTCIHLLAFALLLSPATGAAQTAGGSPALLAHQTFYLASLVDELQAGTWDPFEHWTSEPQVIFFLSPGRLVVSYGQEKVACRFKAKGQDAGYALELRCDGAKQLNSWTWLEGGRAQTDLLTNEDGSPAVVAPLSLVAFSNLVRSAESREGKRRLDALAGRWVGAGGRALVLGGDGTSWNGRPAEAWAQPCLLACALPAITCVELHTIAPRPLLLAAVPSGDAGADLSLVEVRPSRDLCPDGRAFERVAGGRELLREKR